MLRIESAYETDEILYLPSPLLAETERVELPRGWIWSLASHHAHLYKSVASYSNGGHCVWSYIHLHCNMGICHNVKMS